MDSALQGTSEQCLSLVLTLGTCWPTQKIHMNPENELFAKESFTNQRFWTGCSFLSVPFGGNVSLVNPVYSMVFVRQPQQRIDPTLNLQESESAHFAEWHDDSD